MLKKEVKDTQISPKKKPKAETMTVKGTVTRNQREILQNLIGIIGSNEQDVVGKILTLWLYNEGFLSKDSPLNKIKKSKP